MFVVVAIVISFGATIVQDLQQEVGNTDTANTTRAGLDGLNIFADWLPTLAIVIVAMVLIGIIVRFMAFGVRDEDDEEDDDNEEALKDLEYDNYRYGLHTKEIKEIPKTRKRSKEKYPFHKEGICVLTGLTIDDDEDCNVCNK